MPAGEEDSAERYLVKFEMAHAALFVWGRDATVSYALDAAVQWQFGQALREAGLAPFVDQLDHSWTMPPGAPPLRTLSQSSQWPSWMTSRP